MAVKEQPVETWLPEFLRIKSEMEDEQRFWAAIHSLGFISKVGVAPDTPGFQHSIQHELLHRLSSHFSITNGRVIMVWFKVEKETFINWSAAGYSYSEYLAKLKKIIGGYIKELEGMLYA
jgi:hypothetical protein